LKEITLYGKLANGHVALVDDEDYELVNQYRWHVIQEPKHRTLYAGYTVYKDGQWSGLRMHNLIMGVKGIDHKDHDGLNNQRSNLRVATQRQNGASRQANQHGTSQLKGVYWDKDAGKWRTSIRVNGRLHNLGRFDDELEAKRVYDAAALEYFGEFAFAGSQCR
jgi:hypothetical protein